MNGLDAGWFKQSLEHGLRAQRCAPAGRLSRARWPSLTSFRAERSTRRFP